MNDNQSYERLIKKKNEGRLLLCRTALIAGYILFALAGILLVLFFASEYPILFALVAVLDFCIYLLTWRLTQIEYEYSIVSGNLYLAKIFGKASRKELFECELSCAVTVAPYSGQYKKDAESASPDKIYKAISSAGASDIWFILFKNETEQKTLLLFEADEHILKHLRRGCPRAVAREKLTSAVPNENKSEK